MKKVLHIINSLGIGGAEKLVADIVSSNPATFDVVTLKETNSFYEKTLEKNNVNLKNLGNGSVYNPILVLKLIPLLRKYNVVHVHLFPALYWAVLAKLISFSTVKIVYTEHNTNNRRRNSFLFKVLDNLIYSKLSFIGSISEGTTTNLKRHLPNIKIPIQTIHNGIDLNCFNSNNIDLKKYDYFEEEDFILIQISSFRAQKDQKTLINALQYLPETIKLILVGDGELIGAHKSLVKLLKLENRVLFLGLRDDIPDLLNYAHVNVVSSNYEGFGLVAVEGMAMNKPVIASDVEGLGDVVKNAGLLFEKGNSKQLAQQILSLHNDKELFGIIAEKCLSRAQDYDIKLMINSYFKIYKNYNS